jgi:hypothetical protein
MQLDVVLIEQAAELVSPVHTALVACDGGRTDPWNRRFQPEGPVGRHWAWPALTDIHHQGHRLGEDGRCCICWSEP